MREIVVRTKKYEVAGIKNENPGKVVTESDFFD